jgi:polyisoprenoid-binding protein YceI
MKRTAIVAILSVLLPVSAVAGWELDAPNSAIRFKTTIYLVNPVRGGFETFSGKFVYDERDMTRSTADITIDVASIRSGIGLRDRDLRGSRFFEAAKFPTAEFRSRKVETVSEGKLRVTGDLTMHGITREEVLDVTGPTALGKGADGKDRIGGTATTTISRKAYGMGGLIGSDEVEISADIRLVRTDGP